MSKIMQHNQNQKQSPNSLAIGKQESAEFSKADGDDSDFEFIEDDFIADDEEFGGASRAVKLSIRALNFNMMLSNKEAEKNPRTTNQRASLLSKASNMVSSSAKRSGDGRQSIV